MSKKKRKAWATKIESKSKPKHKEVDICEDCNMYYKGVIMDGSGKVLKTIGCKNHCPWRMG